MRKLTLALALTFLLSIGFVPVQAQGQEAEPVYQFNIAVLYDTNGDGASEAVPFLTPVYIRESGSSQEFVGFTNAASIASFLVPPGTYYYEATPKQTEFFYTWVCKDNRFVDKDMTVVLRCEKKFFLRLPFTKG